MPWLSVAGALKEGRGVGEDDEDATAPEQIQLPSQERLPVLGLAVLWWLEGDCSTMLPPPLRSEKEMISSLL